MRRREALGVEAIGEGSAAGLKECLREGRRKDGREEEGGRSNENES